MFSKAQKACNLPNIKQNAIRVEVSQDESELSEFSISPQKKLHQIMRGKLAKHVSPRWMRNVNQTGERENLRSVVTRVCQPREATASSKPIRFLAVQWKAVTVTPSEIGISQEPWQVSQNCFGSP